MAETEPKSSPAFQFYIGDFVSDTMDLSAEEIGVYMLLICSCWKKKGLPFDEKKRSKISRITLKKFQKYWSNSLVFLFYYHEETATWQHSRLDKEREKQRVSSQKAKDAANERWKKEQEKPDADASAKHSPSNALHSSSSSSSKKREEKKEEISNDISLNADTSAGDVLEVFTNWQIVLNHPKAILDKPRIARISARLKQFSVDELKLVPHGVLKSPHHMGDNPQRTKYDDISTIYRDAAQVEKFIEFSKIEGSRVTNYGQNNGNAKQGIPGPGKRSNIEAIRDRKESGFYNQFDGIDPIAEYGKSKRR